MVSGELLPWSANEGRVPDKFKSQELFCNLSGICREFSGVFKLHTTTEIRDKFQTLEFVWNR